MVHEPIPPSGIPGGLQHSTRAVINLKAFRSNLDVVRRNIGPGVKIMAVLKSNAYGHGVYEIAREAVRWGVDYLAVARSTEGMELRNQGIERPVLVCEIVSNAHIARCLEDELDLTVSTVEGAAAIASVAQHLRRRVRVHVKVDTGMGRLGFQHSAAADAIEAVARMSGIELSGVYSHFATSEESDRTFAREQIGRFSATLDEVRKRGIDFPLRHMANSGAILNFPEAHFDMVRPGLMLYGYTPARVMSGATDLSPVMSLISRVSHVKSVAPHQSISYSRKYFTAQQTRIATVPIGYGDGYSRSLTNKANVLIRGRRFPVVGTVCMDHIMVDLGGDESVHVDDEVVLIGEQGGERISCWEIAENMGTIPYEVTCLITPRVRRVFSNGSLTQSSHE